MEKGAGSIHSFPSIFNLFNRKMLGKLWLSLAWERSIHWYLYWAVRILFFPGQGRYVNFLLLYVTSVTQTVTLRCYLLAAQINSPLCFYGGQFWILRGLEDIGWSLWFPARLSRGPRDLVQTISLSKHLSHNGVSRCLLGHGLQKLIAGRAKKAITPNITEPA